MLNFSADIFFWTILQLSFTENILNYYIEQKECLGLTNKQKKKKKKKEFEIFNSWDTLYLFLHFQLAF